jgi:molybdopterin-guanine dinucleotide biosynthesis protein MobB
MTKALIILCGGLSTRMGCDKAFLPFGDTPLLKYQIQRFEPYFSNIYLSVPKHEERPIDYTAHFGYPVIEDEYAHIGPMGGLYSCLHNTTEDVLFFTAVDAPFTDPKLALDLCSRLESEPNKYACAIQNPEGRIQPLFAAYTKDCLPVIERLIEKESYKLKMLLTPKQTIIPDMFLPPEQFFNMNDPASYYYALQKLASKKPGMFPAGFDSSVSTSKKAVPVISFTAKSGTGKTTYLEKLIPLLKKEHLRLAVIKHDAHGFEIDKPGKDSYRLTHAGADHMILTNENQTAAIIAHHGQHPDLDTILSRIEHVDFIITEGYKLCDQPKIHLLRKGYNETPVGNQENVIAYVTDFSFEADVPVFDLNRPEDLVPFLKEKFCSITFDK